ncbi:MAG: LON peptidase substrate-binding domain-containing protein [Thermomicrobiales bacterium]
MAEFSNLDLPLFPLNTVLFPGIDLPLHIFEERYRQLIHDRQDANPAFGVVLITGGSEVGDQPETANVGTAASIEVLHAHDDGRFDLVVRGGRRFRIHQRNWSRPYLVGTIEWLPDDSEEDVYSAMVDNAWRSFVALANAYLSQTTRFTKLSLELETRGRPSGMSSAELAYVLASRLPVASVERQELLEASTIEDLLMMLVRIMSRERRLVNRIGATVVIAGGTVKEQRS